MKFKTPYTENSRLTLFFEKPSLTDESFKNECDLGFIVENYLNKGLPLPSSTFNYQDCTTVQQYQDAMYVVAEAKSNFEQLPAKERDRFGSVEGYLDFISKPENLKECYEKKFIDPSSVSFDDVYKTNPVNDDQTSDKSSESVSEGSTPPPTE